ncbi:hypothetical protein EXIGLDRAFT_726113 [Exidia glandulosa HHB12029]|uniref:F-box domain-containing protein n=1 Tax=Exidia glandulosa HHB12029 TaxID=1314781 RepID=A0A165DVF9_EXIGL|nr:hypothetical protein EXIGLDRAFT_726113 [Exidia glandulosa HHB12029]
MAKATDLPPELVLQILEHTRPDSHRSLDWVNPNCASLATYTLICRAWRSSSQVALFRIVRVVDGRAIGTAYNSLISTLNTRPDLARAVEKLEVGLRSTPDLMPIARTVSLCLNLRHFSVVAQYWEDPVVGFRPAELDLLEERRTNVTHLTARMFATESEECQIVPQLLRVWPAIRYVELRGRGTILTTLPPMLRELRLPSSYRCRADSAPHLRNPVVHASRLVDFEHTWSTIRRLQLIIESPDMTVLGLWNHLSRVTQLDAVDELILSTDRLWPGLLDALPPNLVDLGLLLRVVLSRAEELGTLVCELRKRGAAPRLRTLTVYSIEPLDHYELGRFEVLGRSCQLAGIQLHSSLYSDLWDVPLQYF